MAAETAVVETTTTTSVDTANQLADAASRSTDAVVSSFNAMMENIATHAPTVISAIVVFVVGYFVARLVAKAITTIGEKLNLQNTAERGGLTTSMRQVGITMSVPQIVGSISFWLLMWVFLIASCNILGIAEAQKAMDQVLGFVPQLFLATIVVVVGLLIATFLKGVVAASADRMGLTYGTQLATGVYWILAFLAFHSAATQLGLETKLFDFAVQAFLVAAALALGLSFGLGGKEVMAGVLSGYYLRQRLQAGDTVQIGEFEGTVRDVGPVATIIETEEAGLVHRHSIPNAKMLNEAVR